MNQLRRILYMLARWLGDANALSRGPQAIAKRVVRKGAYKAFASILNRLLR